VNWFRLPDGSMRLSKPKFTVPPEDSLGRTMWNGKKVKTQRVFDEVFDALRRNYDDCRQLWILSSVKRWGAFQATEKQMELVRRFWPEPPEGMTKLEAMQVITGGFCDGRPNVQVPQVRVG
jgi:hypothetical protein